VNVLDLFSGIGGFSLGLERAGMRTVAFCEIDGFARRVLARHWPDVPVYPDVRELTAASLASDGIGVDVICGGFPCQDISGMGKREGLEGDRSGLWREYARLIGELRPRYVIVENVAALLERGLGRVLGDLTELGYDAEWDVVPAAAVGAPQFRERVWILAHPMQGPERPRWVRGLCEGETPNWPGLVLPVGSGVADGIPDWVDRVGACGNAVVHHIPELIGRAIMNAEGLMRNPTKEKK
jgi:DNA (cytosine-5)-methyltransferase 1